ncbi:MAG: hypothetical protein AAGK00_10680 [Pseudomonadota bacterium]
MSDTDSFIQEVSEEVRQDRMYALWKKWGPLVIGGIAVVVGGAAFWSWQKAQDRAAAEVRGGTFIAADPAEINQMTALPERVDGPAQLIAQLAAAAALAEEGQAEEALAAYQAVVARPDLAPEYADLAALQVARLTVATGDAEGARQGLAVLVEANRPYRLLALELRAALAMAAGDVEAAQADLRVLVADPAATPGQRQRALAMLEITGAGPVENG